MTSGFSISNTTSLGASGAQTLTMSASFLLPSHCHCQAKNTFHLEKVSHTRHTWHSYNSQCHTHASTKDTATQFGVDSQLPWIVSLKPLPGVWSLSLSHHTGEWSHRAQIVTTTTHTASRVSLPHGWDRRFVVTSSLLWRVQSLYH